MITALLSPVNAFRLVEMILATGVIISSLELLTLGSELQDIGFLSWRIHRLSNPIVAKIAKRTCLEVLFRHPNVCFLIAFRLAAGAALALSAALGIGTVIPLALVTLSGLAFTLRSPAGNDGSDQMSLILLLACTLAKLVGSAFATEAALVFITGEAIVAYGTSGFLKMGAAGWRNGSTVRELLATSSFGNQVLWRLVNDRGYIAASLGLAVIFIDSFVSLSFALPYAFCLTILTFGLLLHLGIALVLGLNTFLWSFTATYPAILWVSLVINHTAGRHALAVFHAG